MIPEFALRLICGLSTVWCIAPRSLITSGFFRIQMLITLGLSVLLTLTRDQLRVANEDISSVSGTALGVGIVLAISSFLGSIAWTLERRKGGTLFAFWIAFASLGSLIYLTFQKASAPSSAWLGIGNQLTAAWLIGGVTATMLLGHWYLTATGMSLKPLIRLTQIFMVAAIFRTILVAVELGIASNASSANWTLQTLRWAGLLGPILMAFLTMRILKYKNTQSATGVLYAATILVFMGEMAASLIQP